MKYSFVFFAFGLLSLNSCSISQEKTTISVEEEVVQPTIITKVKVVEPAEYKSLMKSNSDFQLIDVRTPEEYGAGHIDNAANINFYDPNFKSDIGKLDKNKTVFIYCRSGGRSGQATEIMKTMGFKEIIDLSGGYMNWGK